MLSLSQKINEGFILDLMGLSRRKKLGYSFVGLGLVSGSKQVAKKFGTEKANLDDEIAET